MVVKPFLWPEVTLPAQVILLSIFVVGVLRAMYEYMILPPVDRRTHFMVEPSGAREVKAGLALIIVAPLPIVSLTIIVKGSAVSALMDIITGNIWPGGMWEGK